MSKHRVTKGHSKWSKKHKAAYRYAEGKVMNAARWMSHIARTIKNPAGLGMQGKAVLSMIASYADKDGRCFPAMKTIAARVGISYEWCRKIVGALANAGFIKRNPRFGENRRQTTNEYVLCVQIPSQPPPGIGQPSHTEQSHTVDVGGGISGQKGASQEGTSAWRRARLPGGGGSRWEMSCVVPVRNARPVGTTRTTHLRGMWESDFLANVLGGTAEPDGWVA